MSADARDAAIRQAAFRFLDDLSSTHPDVLPWSALQRGFDFDGDRVPLVSQQGIFKPRLLELPISMRTTPPKPGEDPPYDDEFGDGVIRYRYRGTDPDHRENAGLREAWRRGTPLIYFHGVAPGAYVAEYPVFILGDDPRALAFTIGVDGGEAFGDARVADGARRYATRLAVTRIHQRSFRYRVLRAYRETCGVCRLRHPELLDAAHIIGDAAGGEPYVSNGLSLCKIHHAAFDANVMGIRPDLVIEIREDVLREKDGPMLRHGLQSAHGERIARPRRVADRPDPERLRERYEEFRAAG